MFSIVMPAYNSENHLCDSIVSIEQQTWGDWELIVVDDASTDRTAEIALMAADEDPRIRVIRHPENRWASEARNTGIKAASGRYLWMCDADDTFSPDLLESCAASVAENPADVVVFGHTEIHCGPAGGRGASSSGNNAESLGNNARADEDGILFAAPIVPAPAICRTPEELRPLIAQLEYLSSYGYPWNKVFRLDYLRDSGVLFERGDFIEDIVFNVKAFQDIGSMNVIDRPLYNYVVREEGSLTEALLSEGYYEKNRHRTQLVRDQLESWGVLDDGAKAKIGNLYARYILSALERNCNKGSGMGRAERAAWLQEVFDDPLFEELIPHAEAPEGSALAIALIPLKDRRLKGTLRMAGLIHFAKGHFGTQLNKLRSQR